MSSLGMQMPGRQRVRPSGVNVYTGLMLGTVACLIGAIAFVLVHEMGVDPLTAYLATSPGGMDTVAIVAIAAGNVDISFVMTMQALRFLFVLIAGPPIARLVASWARP